MRKQAPQVEEVETQLEQLVTLSELVAEPGLIYGDFVEQLADRLGDEVVEDDLGRRCVTRETARRLVAERKEREARLAEDQHRREEEAAQKKRVAAGVPGVDGLSPIEVMMQSGDYQTPQDEFRARSRSVLRRQRWTNVLLGMSFADLHQRFLIDELLV